MDGHSTRSAKRRNRRKSKHLAKAKLQRGEDQREADIAKAEGLKKKRRDEEGSPTDESATTSSGSEVEEEHEEEGAQTMPDMKKEVVERASSKVGNLLLDEAKEERKAEERSKEGGRAVGAPAAMPSVSESGKEAEKRNKRDARDRDEEDLRRSEGEGMLYAADTLEEEQTPRPGKFETQAEKHGLERLEKKKTKTTTKKTTKKGEIVETEKEERREVSYTREAWDRDDADLMRSEWEGMRFDEAVLEEEQTPRQLESQAEKERLQVRYEQSAPTGQPEEGRKAEERNKRDARDSHEEDLRRSEGEGMLYDAATLEEEQKPKPGKFETQQEKEQRMSKREGKQQESSEEAPDLPKGETDREAYERLMHEAAEEHKQLEEEEIRQQEEMVELEQERQRMAADWNRLEQQKEEARRKQEEEERESREKVQALVQAAEEEERQKRKMMKEREAREKTRREAEIEELVMRQSMEISNKREDLLHRSRMRLKPVVWVPDEQVSACQSCQEQFTLTKRRHHCRACGKIFCAKCSSKTSRVRWCADPERVCDQCFVSLKGFMEGQTVLMSGSNSGVAAEAAEEMARQGAQLALLCTNREEAFALAEHIKRATGNSQVLPLWADFSSLESVHEAVEQFRSHYDRLDVLINNCSVFPKSGRSIHTVTQHGHEKLFSLNYLSHVLVTYAVLDLLKLSAPSRIVNVSPRPSEHIYVDFDDFQMENRWSDNRAIEQSRLGIHCLTRELGHRLKESGVVVNVLDLGHVYNTTDSLLSRAWSSIKGDTPADEAKNGYLYMAASPLTQEVSRGCFLPDGTPTLFRGRVLDNAFCAHFLHASYDCVGPFLARHDERGVMEGRMMESTMAERIRAAGSWQEDDEARRRHIEAQDRGIVGEVAESTTTSSYVEGSGVSPIRSLSKGAGPEAPETREALAFERLHHYLEPQPMVNEPITVLHRKDKERESVSHGKSSKGTLPKDEEKIAASLELW